MGSSKTRAGVARSSNYHHGALREALLGAAEEILEREGIQALTLRAAARAASVSHAAPAHHFGDLTGLLSELAATGFERFTAALTGAMDQAGTDPEVRLTAMGRAYVAFARAHTGLFLLMFRGERLNMQRPALYQAIVVARQALAAAVSARPGGGSPGRLAEATAVWSLVHGFALLLVDGRLRGMLEHVPGNDPDRLLDATLACVRLK
jgi:AcrR family transcriptional regulator